MDNSSETVAAVAVTGAVTAADNFCRPVYEPFGETPQGRRLVMTPCMLLDGLKECQEDVAALRATVARRGLGQERRHGLLVNPLEEKLEKLQYEVNYLLKLLWRSGLWTEDSVTEAVGSDGRRYQVVREPFTDGKPGGRPLAPNAPAWQRELLGLPPVEFSAGDAPPVGAAKPDSPDEKEERDEAQAELLLAHSAKV